VPYGKPSDITMENNSSCYEVLWDLGVVAVRDLAGVVDNVL
jgi:hypothetical protein